MKVKKIHFVGIKGVGQTALAVLAKEAGMKVTGSDIEEDFITADCLKKAGITDIKEFSEENISDQDLVITTGAHGGFNNIEVEAARKKNIKVITKGEAVGVFMDGTIFGRKFSGISVAGSHGKTTVTAMIATVLKENGMDPSFVVGTGIIASLGNSGHFGKGKFFVAEADEYATEPNSDKTPQFLWQKPKIAVFTNIELDHPDMYESAEAVRFAFLRFAKNLPKDGVLVLCKDSEQNILLEKDYKARIITYGFSPESDFVLEKVRISELQTFFWVRSRGTSLGEFALKIPGEHNALNALGASVALLEAGLPVEAIKKGLIAFLGTKRRFEWKGELPEGAQIYDDYAHHPTEIHCTLKAFKESFPKKKVICIFQPHTYSRTIKLFEQFSRSFTFADEIILIDIFSSARETEDKTVSSKTLADKIRTHGRNSLYLPSFNDVIEYIDKKQPGKDSIIVTMGAGDVYKIGEKLLDNK